LTDKAAPMGAHWRRVPCACRGRERQGRPGADQVEDAKIDAPDTPGRASMQGALPTRQSTRKPALLHGNTHDATTTVALKPATCRQNPLPMPAPHLLPRTSPGAARSTPGHRQTGRPHSWRCMPPALPAGGPHRGPGPGAHCRQLAPAGHTHAGACPWGIGHTCTDTGQGKDNERQGCAITQSAGSEQQVGLYWGIRARSPGQPGHCIWSMQSKDAAARVGRSL
jgi:hypothetical protein